MLVQLLGNQQLNNLVEESICSSLEKKKRPNRKQDRNQSYKTLTKPCKSVQ